MVLDAKKSLPYTKYQIKSDVHQLDRRKAKFIVPTRSRKTENIYKLRRVVGVGLEETNTERYRKDRMGQALSDQGRLFNKWISFSSSSFLMPCDSGS